MKKLTALSMFITLVGVPTLTFANTVTCTPTSPVATISGVGNQTHIQGNCKTITLQGTDNEITAESADTLIVEGADNQVTINTVNRIKLAGADSHVRYHSSMTGKKPMISVQGADSNTMKF